MQQEASTEKIIQNINNNNKNEYDITVKQEVIVNDQVCLAEDINNCFQNNHQNNKNDRGLLEPEQTDDDSQEVVLEAREIIKQIYSNPYIKTNNFMSLITTDEELLHYTGVNFFVLKKLGETALLMELSRANKCFNYQLFRDQIILCLCKLKRNYSFRDLSILFRMNLKECEDNFYYMIALLSEILQRIMHWPGKEEVLQVLPQSLLNFIDVRVVFHCIEIALKKPPICFKCTFCAHYLLKQCATVKFIVAITPSGLISFVSKTYASLASTETIIGQSTILKNIDFNTDAIIVNNCLAADLKKLEKQVKIVKPYNLDTKTQFSDEEKKFNSDFKAFCVQVDKTIEKFNQFKILQGSLAFELACCIDDIAIVIAGLINLQE